MPAVAIVAAGVIAAGASIYSANKAAKATKDAASSSADTSAYIYDQNKALFEPYYNVGVSALPGLQAWDANNPMPSYQKEVMDPMNSWNYTQSPAYEAKNSLAQQALNRQLQARGLSASGVGANRQADLSRKLTSEDYNSERNYRLGQYTDKYKSLLNDNTTRYNQLLDKVKIGQGAAGSLGQAGNTYASEVGKSTTDAGNAEAGFYAGLPGAALNTVSTGLKTYDTGQRAGWWNSNTSPSVGTSPLPNMPDSDNYSYNGLYNSGGAF
jgi:hypothetical protein